MNAIASADTTARVDLKILPRLLDSVDLALPKVALEAELLRWARRSGFPLVSVADLPKLQKAFSVHHGLHSEDSALDVQLAIDAIEGLRKRPVNGFPAYVQAWEARMHLQQTIGQGDEFRLRALQAELGGILIDGRHAPYILLIPQEDGTWIQMGWEVVTQFDRSPLGPDRQNAQVIAQHELAAAQRKYLRTD